MVTFLSVYPDFILPLILISLSISPSSPVATLIEIPEPANILSFDFMFIGAGLFG